MGSVTLSSAFSELIGSHEDAQQALLKEVNELSSDPSSITPGKMMLLQLKFSSLTQIGDTVSNLIYSFNNMVNNAVRNQK